MQALCSIFFHNYYGNHPYWMDYFSKTIAIPSHLYYNSVEDSLYNTGAARPELKDENPGTDNFISSLVVRQSSNQGKDIGGKMVLMDAYQQLNIPTEYGLLLHDKKSPYKANNQTWADNLFSIAGADFSKKAMQVFSRWPEAGIITANGNIADEMDHGIQSFKSNNRTLLPVLQQQYQIQPAGWQYVAGTMFWFRMAPVQAFFKKYPPLGIRAMLEPGNVTDEYAGSYTHSWERLLCWIITSQQYSIKSI